MSSTFDGVEGEVRYFHTLVRTCTRPGHLSAVSLQSVKSESSTQHAEVEHGPEWTLHFSSSQHAVSAGGVQDKGVDRVWVDHPLFLAKVTRCSL